MAIDAMDLCDRGRCPSEDQRADGTKVTHTAMPIFCAKWYYGDFLSRICERMWQ